MRLPRIQSRIAALMASIASVAVLLAAARGPSVPLIALAMSLAIATLLTASWQARIATTTGARAWWLGFAIFGWIYFGLAGWSKRPVWPTTILVGGLADWLTIYAGPYPTPMGIGPWYTADMHEANTRYSLSVMSLAQIYLTLLVALAGAMLTWSVAGLVSLAIAYARGFRKLIS